ncbi:hypothetical protein ACUXAV_005605 [Cupriavidus metallidurans]|nr:hypothetical protein [Cupriavidus metallidurans]
MVRTPSPRAALDPADQISGQRESVLYQKGSAAAAIAAASGAS